MYNTLLFLHSTVRWFVFLGLIYAIYISYRGWLLKRTFTRVDNLVRHWTATFAHIQLVFGLWLYFVSPIMNYFMRNFNDAVHQREVRFFGMEHSLMMFLAIVIITVGSAKAKRKKTDTEKFKTMAIWFSVSFVIILVSIPWPFSPMASRPWLR